MRYISIAALLILLVACSTGGHNTLHDAETFNEIGAVTYYDRNNDGVTDLELHQPHHCDDCNWALVDADFNGRYEKRVRWSFGVVKEAVDLPVPRDVLLTTGKPLLSGWED